VVRSTRIIHKDREFLIQDSSVSSATRTITFLGRPEASELEAPADGAMAIKTNHGVWIPIAIWEKGSIRTLSSSASEDIAMFQKLLNKYLRDGNREMGDIKRHTYFYVEKDGLHKFNILSSHPNGLVIELYTKKSIVEKALGPIDASSPFKIRRTSNLKKLLTTAADEGYAGAILDNTDPVYFCLDHDENIVFLRLTMDEYDEVGEAVLDENGAWETYEGDLDIEFYLDQDVCDQNMVRNLGEIPFIGHDDMDQAWTIESTMEKGTPFVLPELDSPYSDIVGDKSIILFRSQQGAIDHILEKGLLRHEAVRVDNIEKFLKNANKNKQTVLFEPFNHRASNGTLWINGEDIIFDSFSGFWIMNKNWKFDKTV